MCKTLFGDEAELIIEEMFKLGQCSMSNVIFKAARRLKMAKRDEMGPTSDVVKNLRSRFIELADCLFLCRVPSPYTRDEPDPPVKPIPQLVIEDKDLFKVPGVNFKALVEAVEKCEEDEPDRDFQCNDKESRQILWRINYERFQREFRDQVIVQAVTRRIDASAGSMMRLLLNIMNETHPWDPVSCHIRLNEILDRLEKQRKTSSDKDLYDFRDQYMKIMEEDRTRFIDKVGDAGGGQFVVNVKHVFKELAFATIESVVLERYGSKALRIFRVIKQKSHLEESVLQNLVMIPAKETKFWTYTLLEANFIKMQELRKSIASNMGKTFYLFYIDLPQAARTVVNLCHLSMSNAFTRKHFEAETNQRLLDKHERIESIAVNLKSSPDFEDSEDLQLQFQEVQDMVI